MINYSESHIEGLTRKEITRFMSALFQKGRLTIEDPSAVLIDGVPIGEPAPGGENVSPVVIAAPGYDANGYGLNPDQHGAVSALHIDEMIERDLLDNSKNVRECASELKGIKWLVQTMPHLTNEQRCVAWQTMFLSSIGAFRMGVRGFIGLMDIQMKVVKGQFQEYMGELYPVMEMAYPDSAFRPMKNVLVLHEPRRMTESDIQNHLHHQSDLIELKALMTSVYESRMKQHLIASDPSRKTWQQWVDRG